ncbi:unnamed protein product [Vitrella brassicaformis CCMP3155]|uniref:Uncharacterized protein n=1 Tax=Vitrella brassicaformis (strain CCMP3155) TaxID=1169540 RepID=A0A0G4EBT4_VITBC|nr:unnamed protein product [Vitrella brassicaformis CCMP3155]|mmetsp:Transcript_35453/g.88117  ORF Transcript_35453/g.88117 Transcript_35453/m.88117 type:complete len:190 (-) Transcript_35453:1242-1811(-)|eukprot:CEL93110.1 unnamed protein product [Vitrella brassicaformis CCMP3155]
MGWWSILLLGLLGGHHAASAAEAASSVCDRAALVPAFGDDSEAFDICCYSGTFLVKMLSELNGGDKKTVDHVYENLQPYLGGAAEISKLPDPAQRADLTNLRTEVGETDKAALQGYDQLLATGLCYGKLTNWILDPSKGLQSKDGVLLAVPSYRGREKEEVIDLLMRLYHSDDYDEIVHSCAGVLLDKR